MAPAGAFCCCCLGLVLAGRTCPLDVMGWTVDLGLLWQVLAAFYLVWMLNLYNFMDGIDGIAGIEAVTVCLGMSIIYAFGGQAGLSWEVLMLGAAAAGFLYWNFPPAKIFMGDAGSGFLGIVLGVLSIQGSWASPQLFWSLVDSAGSVCRRCDRNPRATPVT
ncbi:hypothetical protein HG619_15390 [Pseudomonas syringae]|nr:hypothetical protein [Pseudomonas syringae]